MKLSVMRVLLFCLVIGVYSVNSEERVPDIRWQSNTWGQSVIGSATCSVTGLFPVQNGKYVLAGTSLGLFIFSNPFAGSVTVKPIPLNTSVGFSRISDFTESKDKKSIAFIGYSFSMQSAVFVAQAFDTAPFYRVRQMQMVPKAQFLAAFGNSMDILYAGCDDKIAQAVKKENGDYGPFQTLDNTTNCFGSSKPVCTGLIYHTDLASLVATGFDSTNNKAKNIFISNGVVTEFSPTFTGDNVCVSHLKTIRCYITDMAWVSTTMYLARNDTIGYRFTSSPNWIAHKIIRTGAPIIDFSVAGTPQPTTDDRQDGTIYFITAIADTFLHYGLFSTAKSIVPVSIPGIKLLCITSIPDEKSFDWVICYIGTNRGAYYNRGQLYGTAISTGASKANADRLKVIRIGSTNNLIRLDHTTAGKIVSLTIYSTKGVTLYTHKNIRCYQGSTDITIGPDGAGLASGKYLAAVVDVQSGVRLYYGTL